MNDYLTISWAATRKELMLVTFDLTAAQACALDRQAEQLGCPIFVGSWSVRWNEFVTFTRAYASREGAD